MRRFRLFLLSFKFKIAFTATLMVLIAAAGVGGVSLLIAESGMRQAIAGQELSMLASAAAYIDNDLQGKQQLLKSVGEQAQGRDFPLEQVQALLESHGTLRDAFYNVTAFAPDGRLIANLGDRRAIGSLNAAKRQYFQDTLASREGLISPAFKSTLSGKPIVVITQPVENARGQIICVLVGAIDLQRPSFSGQLEALHATLDGYLFIVAGDGTAIHHPDKEQILSRNSAISAEVTDAVLATSEGWRDDLLDDGEPVLLAHRRLRRVDWTIAVSSPLHRVFAPMLSVRLRTLGATSVLTALAGLFAWILVKLLVTPLARLHQHIDDIAAGKAGIDVFDIAREDEFGALSRAFYTLSKHQAETERDLHRLATTDALTSANNRRMFDAYFPTALARAHRAGQQVGLAILDVDKFKAINDTHGHAAGDAVLVEFARRLMRTVRCTDTVARLAGDEFVIVYEQLGAATEINVLGNKILDAMAAPFQIGDQELAVTVSVGIALTTATPATVDDVIRAADQALYGVKAAGRNGFAINYVGAERVVRSRARAARDAGQEQTQAL